MRERFSPCTHGFPRCPPHADARSWARHRSVGKGCAGRVLGVCAGCGSGWGSGRGVENGAPSAQAIGSVSNPRRTCRSDRDRKGSARARQKLGGGWQDASGLADPSPHPLPPAPPRVRFAEFRLVFLVSVGQEERSMSIFIPGRAPPLPTSHRPPPQHRSRRPVHRVAHAPSREASKHADGWRSWSYLSTLKLAKKTPLISPVPRLRRSCPRSEATCTGEQRWWVGASTRRVVAARARWLAGANGRRSVYLTMLCAVRSGCGPWDRLGRNPHLVLQR